MADLERMKSALRNAHKAGDVVAAKKIANAIKAADQKTDRLQTPMNALSHLTQAAAPKGPQEDTDRLVRANMEARKLFPAASGSMAASSGGIASGGMFGFDDEIGGGVTAPFRAVRDRVGLGEAYKREVALNRALKAKQREAHPIASIAGEVGGGLATGGTLAKGGLTIAGKSMPVFGKVGSAALEGAAYGGAYGAGNADNRAMLPEALKGAATGALVGAGTQAIGGAVSNAMKSRAAAKAAPALEELKQAGNRLYQQADAAGIVIKPEATTKLANNVRMAAGHINNDLRRNTAGMVDLAAAKAGKPMTLRELDELRQVVGDSMQRAEPQDVRTLMRIKDVLDGFADNAKPSDITGDIRGFDLIKQARAIWQRKAKTEAIETLLDLADVDTGKYTQSGMANAIKLKAKQLYKQISSGKQKGWSAEEIALIRQMAKGGSNSQMVNWLAKFAPRGVVSFGSGSGIGGAAGALAGGPVGGFVGGAALPAAGYVAGNVADRGALAAAQSLRNAAASGTAPVVLNGANNLVRFIPGATIATQEMTRGLLQPNGRAR